MAKPITPEQLNGNGGLSRADARLCGHSRYKSDKPCTNCGNSTRYVASKVCVDCHRENMSKPLSEKQKEKRRERWGENAIEINNKRRLNHKQNPNIKRTYSKIWRDANPDKMLKYSINNRVSMSKATTNWRKRNPNKVKETARIGYHNRRSRIKATGERLNKNDFNTLITIQSFKCFWCYELIWTNWHPDHVIPISKFGKNSIDNIVISCISCNLQKGSKLPEDWFKHPRCRAKNKW